MLNYFPLMWDYTTTKNVYYKKKKKIVAITSKSLQ